MTPWASPLLTIFSYQFLKKKSLQRIYKLLIQYLFIDKILISDSSDNFQKCLFKWNIMKHNFWIIQFNFNSFFYSTSVSDLNSLSSKKKKKQNKKKKGNSIWLVDKIFENLDDIEISCSKRNIEESVIIIRNSIHYLKSFNSITSHSSFK